MTSAPLSKDEIDVHKFRPAGSKISAEEAARKVRQQSLGRYFAYTKRYDEVVDAADVVNPEEVLRLFGMIGGQARILQREYEHDMIKFEDFLSRQRSLGQTSITILVDHSGSMRQKILTVAAWVLNLAECLERHGVRSEVIGYTTRAWKGGRARDLWVKHGKPPNPGSLNDIRYIVYKSFSDNVVDAGVNFSAMLQDGLLKENIDGEALIWASERLSAEISTNKMLLVLNDGAPVDDSTLLANPENILHDHSKDVIMWLTQQKRIIVCAVGIETNALAYYPDALLASNPDWIGPKTFDILSAMWSR
nr:hypothetical protein [uncultured Rhodopila sp.]